MTHLPDEARLAVTLLLSAFVFVCSYRFAARTAPRRDWISNSFDAFLLTYLVQYLAVALPGIFGVLSAMTMCLVAIVLSVAMLVFPPLPQGEGRGEGLRDASAKTAPHPNPLPKGDGTGVAVFCLLFVLGFLSGIIGIGLYAPPMVDDALTYHLPAAVQWLRTGHLGLYTTWFFNPANTYSPLAGSTFMAWLIGPTGNDVLVRWVQMPALLMIYFGVIELCRALGVRTAIAAMIATGAVLSRPLVSQSFEVKDDLFAAAFFLAAAIGCAPMKLRDALGPWRIGIALGLFFAIKYTVLLSAPLLFLLMDPPIRAKWSWKSWAIMIACATLLAGPWYARNWIVAGNPLFPIPLGPFKGMFAATRSTEMNSLTGLLNCLTDLGGKFHSPAPVLMAILLLGCGAAALAAALRGRLLIDPLARLCIIGPILGIAFFILAAHAGEFRYLYPSLLLLYACCAIAANAFPAAPLALLAAATLAGLSIWGSFADKQGFVLWFSIYGATVGAIGTGVFALLRSKIVRANRNLRIALWTIIALPIIAFVYIYFPAEEYFAACRREQFVNWIRVKGDQAVLWQWVDQNTPPDATIAYTNAYMIHAMQGFDFRRTLAYAPTRPGVRFYHALPRSRERVSDQEIRGFVARLLTAEPDHETWLRNLREMHPQFLLVGKQDVLHDPPERIFADDDSAHFQKIFENQAGIVYRVVQVP